MHVVVIGQGYVGLPLALRMAEAGLKVTGLESHVPTVELLNAGHSHILDVTDDALAIAAHQGFRASSDPGVIASADAVVVCVPTPLSESGGPDLAAVEAAGDLIGQHLTPGTLVVLESTTYPGTTEEVFAPRVNSQNYVVGEDIFIAYSPERVDPGNATYGIRNTPKVVGGITAACTEKVAALYGQFVDQVVTAKGTKEAELSKLLENTFRHVNIALVNEMLRFSNELDVDLWDAIECAETKPFGFMAFRPGPGVGGHCIPIDPSYLSHRVRARLGYSFRMVELAEEINTAAPHYVAQRVWQALNKCSLPVARAKVLLLGVTYKPNIPDQRESPADPLAKALRAWGADIRYHDPFVPDWTPKGFETGLASVASPEEGAADADLVVLLQAHAQYNLPAILKASSLFLDTRGALRGISDDKLIIL